MKPAHFAILGAMLAAVALQIAGLDHWGDAVKPQFVAGVLLAVASTLTAMFSDKPSNQSAAPLGVVTKIAPMLLLAGVLGVGVTTAGCAKKAPVLSPTQTTKALDAVRRAGIAVQQVQALELALYADGAIPVDLHARIETVFKKAADTVIQATNVLQAAGSTDTHALIAAVGSALKELSVELGHLGQPDAARLAGWIDTAEGLIELALS